MLDSTGFAAGLKKERLQVEIWLFFIVVGAISLIVAFCLPNQRNSRPRRSELMDDPDLSGEPNEISLYVSMAGANLSHQQPHQSAPDMFDENRIHHELQTLIDKPGRISQHFDVQRKARQHDKEVAILRQWKGFFDAGAETIKSKTELLRARSEYLGLQRETEEKNALKEANIAKHQADAEQDRTRAAKARDERQPQTIIPADNQPKLTADQQRRLKRMEIEDKLRELDRLEQAALQAARDDDDDRLRIQNMYSDRREELREQLSKYLV
jgi:hypothetical protein